MNLKDLLPKAEFPINPYWELSNEMAMHFPIVKIKPKGFMKSKEAYLIETLKHIRKHFKDVYTQFGTECQVVIVPKDHPTRLPELTLPEGFPWRVVIPTQQNTPVLTTGDEEEWHREFNPSQLPIARVHSHHVLEPYQSMTDYRTLNSGTLEVVIGNIWDEGSLHICYWLTTVGDESPKQIVKHRQYPLS